MLAMYVQVRLFDSHQLFYQDDRSSRNFTITYIHLSRLHTYDQLTDTVKIIFAAILERIFFHVYPSPLSLLGTIVILSCAIYVAVRYGR